MFKGQLSVKLIKLGLVSTLLVLGQALDQKPANAQSETTDEEAVSPPSIPPNLPQLPVLSETAPLVEDTYILGVGDSLQVDVFNIPDYSGEFRILSSGSLNIPVVGSILVEGLSVQQATDQIEQSLANYVRRPNVTISLIRTRPIQIAIAGEVRRPGAYQVTTGGEDTEAPTLTQAIELAAGITQLADIRQIEVKRRLPGVAQLDTSSARFSEKETAAFQSIPIDLWELLKEGDLSKDIQLQDGDRIIIPTASTVSADEITELATASFSPDQITVNVVGEVGSPGSVLVPPNTPLNQAILAAGGFNTRAKKGTVNLVRLNPNGTATEREIEVDFARGINEDNNPSLRPNDTIIVQRSGLARTSDTFGGILAPLNFGVNILRLFGL